MSRKKSSRRVKNTQTQYWEKR